MYGAAKVFGAIVILFIIVSLSIIAVVWIMPEIETSIELSEIQTIRNQFEGCNDKIMETARTGSTNKCFFSANKGELTIDTDSINYKITSRAEICDQHPWFQIDGEKYVWQKCEVSDNKRIFELMWEFTPTGALIIEFQFSQEKLRNVVEISRFAVTETTIILNVT